MTDTNPTRDESIRVPPEVRRELREYAEANDYDNLDAALRDILDPMEPLSFENDWLSVSHETRNRVSELAGKRVSAWQVIDYALRVARGESGAPGTDTTSYGVTDD